MLQSGTHNGQSTRENGLELCRAVRYNIVVAITGDRPVAAPEYGWICCQADDRRIKGWTQ